MASDKTEERIINLKKHFISERKLVQLIINTGKIDYYLRREKLRKLKLQYNGKVIVELIKATGRVDDYLKFEKLNELNLINDDKLIIELIKATGKVEEYLKQYDLIESIVMNYAGVVTELIKTTGKSEEYLKPDKLKELNLQNDKDTKVELIKATGKIEDYLTPEKMKELDLIDSYWIKILLKELQDQGKDISKYLLMNQDINDSNVQFSVINLIKATGKIEDYFTREKLEELELDIQKVIQLIKETGKIEDYLTRDKLEELNLQNDKDTKVELIKATGKIEDYLTPEKMKELDLINNYSIKILLKDLQNQGKDISKYLLNGQDINDSNVQFSVINLIKATGKIEDYLIPEKIIDWDFLNSDSIKVLLKELQDQGKDISKYLLNGQDINDSNVKFGIANLIKATGKIEDYLTPDKLEELNIRNDNNAKVELIKATGKIEDYLTPDKLKELNLQNDNNAKVELIKATGKIEDYLTPDKLEELNIRNDNNAKVELIKATGKVEDYLTPEKTIDFNLLPADIISLVKETGKLVEYVNTGKMDKLLPNELLWRNLSKEDVLEIWENLPLDKKKYYIESLCNGLCYDNKKTELLPYFLKEVYGEKIDTTKLLDVLTLSENSYISHHLMPKILNQDKEENIINIDEVNKNIANTHEIFLTNDLPEVFKLFKYFQFHDNYKQGNKNLYKDVSLQERDKTMISDLLVSSLDSDNSQLYNFFELLYSGNIAFQKFKNGEQLDKTENAILYSYSIGLTNLYNLFKDEKELKDKDYISKIEDISNKLQLENGENVGDILIKRYLNDIGFKVEEYNKDNSTILEDLLEFMDENRKEANERNKSLEKSDTYLQER